MTRFIPIQLNTASLRLLFAAAVATISLSAQQTTADCKNPPIIPLSRELPPAKIIVDPPLAEPLALRGVAIFQHCALNLHIVPVFGPNALAVTPRVGHLHVTLDGAPWHWLESSGTPIVLQGLLPGEHKLLVELADSNHHILDKKTVTFTIPEKATNPRTR